MNYIGDRVTGTNVRTLANVVKNHNLAVIKLIQLLHLEPTTELLHLMEHMKQQQSILQEMASRVEKCIM